MKEKLYNFLKGRNGADQLTKFLLYLSISLMLLGTLLDLYLINFMSLLVILYANFRVFSKNIKNRVKENQKFILYLNKIRNVFIKNKNRVFGKDGYKYFECSYCKQELRVPKGKGNLNIKCPKCNNLQKIKS